MTPSASNHKSFGSDAMGVSGKTGDQAGHAG
jgi:hypothetical protein